MNEVETKVIGAWRKAAADLGIRFSSPFTATRDGRNFKCIGFVHHFGGHIGTVISVIGGKSRPYGLQVDGDYNISYLSPGYGEYTRDRFIDMLEDWRFFGPDVERPAWYTGKYEF